MAFPPFEEQLTLLNLGRRVLRIVKRYAPARIHWQGVTFHEGTAVRVVGQADALTGFGALFAGCLDDQLGCTARDREPTQMFG